MSKITKLPGEKTNLCEYLKQKVISNSNFSVAYQYPRLANKGRTTTTYNVSDDINDPAQAGLFFYNS
jgi:hypothetical protein